MNTHWLRWPAFLARTSVRPASLFCFALAGLLLASSSPAAVNQQSNGRTAKGGFARPHLADYDSELRRADRRIDVDEMARRLQELGVTTYYWLIWHAATDWDDLKLFLPKAANANIEVWVYLVPPSEEPAPEPFRLDYPRWAEEIARLSIAHTNLTAWVIDDFYANHKLFTPAYLRDLQLRTSRLNPKLAFLPLMYFDQITAQFVGDYHQVIDGVVVAYPQDMDEIRYARAILKGEVRTMPGQISCPWNTRTSAGDFAAAELPARVVSTNAVRLRFREQDDFTGATAGYHFKQLLVDGAVVWEQDVAGGDPAWHDIGVDIARQARGKATVTLAFRLLDKKGVSNFGVRWRVRDLRAEGLELSDKLSGPSQWRVLQRGPLQAEFGETQETTRARFEIPFIVMTAADAGEFRLRHGEPASPERIAEWLRMSLQAMADGQCDGVVTYCLDKRARSTTFPLAQQLFHDATVGKSRGGNR